MINSIILPLEQKSVVLPNVAICSILPEVPTISACEHNPRWMLGKICYNDMPMPLISLEDADKDNQVIVKEHCLVAILNLINADQSIINLAILLYSTPKLIAINKETIKNFDNEQGNILRHSGNIANTKVWLLDLDALYDLAVAKDIL